MKKPNFLCALVACTLLVSLAMPAAFADNSAAADTLIAIDDAVTVASGETYYNNGDVAFNNGGTVYNNGGTVFNNGGVVYNNDGVVFNNGGTVFNNSGTVHNNSGRVEDNRIAAAAVTGAGKLTDTADNTAKADAEEEAARDFVVTLASDYSALCDITGLAENADGTYTIPPDGEAVIAARPGLTLTDAFTTAGACTMDDNGTVTLAKLDRDGKLTLKFKLDTPVIAPGAGAYGDDTLISITAADGADIYYTLDGSDPTEESTKYTEPFELDSSAVLKAVAVMDGAKNSDTAEASYIFPVVLDVRFVTAEVGYKEIAAKPVTVKNTGLGALKIASAALAGEDKDAFTLSTEKGGTVATGQSNTKTWTVAPKTSLAAGEYEAEVVFTLDSGDTVDADLHFTVKAPATKKA